MNCSLPGSFVLGIFQARILEWVAISSSKGFSQPRDRTHVSCISKANSLSVSHWGSPSIAALAFYYLHLNSLIPILFLTTCNLTFLSSQINVNKDLFSHIVLFYKTYSRHVSYSSLNMYVRDRLNSLS